MSSVLDFRQSSGVGSDRITVDLPPNDASILLYAVVNLGAGSSASTISTPSGWTQEIGSPFSLAGSPYGVVAIFKKIGDGSTSVSFLVTPSATPFFGDAVVFTIGEPDTGTPTLTPTFVTNTSAVLHSANSVTTTQPNQLLMGIWTGQLSALSFTAPVDMDTQLSIPGELVTGVTGSHFPLLIATVPQAVAGASGVKRATTQFNENSLGILVAFKVNPNPSIPTVLYAAGGENLTEGATVALKCSVATSPTVAASAIQYEFSSSLDNGGSWTLIGLSPAGVPMKTWPVSATLGNTNLIRVRAFDGTLYSLLYGYGTAFNIVAEANPAPPPTITIPTSGSVQPKSATLPIAWNYAGGPGNPQTQYTGQWATNPAFTSPTAIGPTSTALQNATIDTSGLTDGQIVYVRIKTKGVSIYSAYSAAIAFIVASAPTTPNITAPTAGSPPTSSSPTETITEASDFVARRMRTVQAGVEVQNDVVESNALSYVRPYAYSNGVAVTIYVSARNQYGLWSAEDSETVTPSYSGPTKPTLAAVKAPDSGYILLQITNSGSLSFDELWRRENGQAKALAIRITPQFAANAQFADFATGSTQSVIYFARAYNGLVFTDSDDTAAQSITLTDIFLHAVSRSNTGSNVLGGSVHMRHLLGSGGHGFDESQITVDVLGRDEPGAIFGETVAERIAVNTFFRFSEQTAYDALLAIQDAQRSGAILLYRDSLANRFFCKLSDLQTTIANEGYECSFSVDECSYSEAI